MEEATQQAKSILLQSDWHFCFDERSSFLLYLTCNGKAIGVFDAISVLMLFRCETCKVIKELGFLFDENETSLTPIFKPLFDKDIFITTVDQKPDWCKI